MIDHDRYLRAKDAFLALCDAPLETRESELERLCAGDEALSAMLRDLLREDETAKQSAAQSNGDAPAEFESLRRAASHRSDPEDTSGLLHAGTIIGRRIGRYTITRLLGAGGMGVVYEAEQDSPRRSVALKLVRSQFAIPGAHKRFEHEAAALARLHHPGIAQIYESGCAEPQQDGDLGTPYFAMELVRGTPLLDYAAAANLDLEARLELMARIADAVQHAHQKGVIHRDLKPANILVEDGGKGEGGQRQPKILDFGIARVLDPATAAYTQQTHIGQLIGTVMYMSPEQASGDPAAVDPRSDVYAMGVILFELLADQPPHPGLDRPGGKLHESLRIIREQEPTRLGSINRRFRGDIETVVARALEKDRDRRYGSAAEFADDLRRILNHEAIHARPATVTYQLRKFARRNRPLVFGASAVFAALLLGLVGVTAALGRAIEARTAEAEQRAIAEAVNDFINDDLLAAVSPYAQGREVNMRAVLDKAAEGIGTRFADRPLVEAEIRATIGKTYWQLGELDLAEPHLIRSLELRRQHLASPRGGGDDSLATSLTQMAHLYQDQGRFDEAGPLYRDALDMRLDTLGEAAPLTLISMSNLAILQRNQGNWAEAVSVAERCLELCRRSQPEDSPERLHATEVLAGIYKDRGRVAESTALYEEVLEIRRVLQAEDHPDILRLLNSLAIMYGRGGRLQESEAFMSESLTLSKRVMGERHPHTLVTVTNLAGLYAQTGRDDKAEALHREALEGSREVLGESHRTTLVAMLMLGRMLVKQGSEGAAEAEALIADAYHRLCETAGPLDLYSLNAARDLALVYLATGRPAEAETLAAAAVKGIREGFDSGSRQDSLLAAHLEVHALALRELGRLDEAQTLQAEVTRLDAKHAASPAK